jgi:hypothetical protein
MRTKIAWSLAVVVATLPLALPHPLQAQPVGPDFRVNTYTTSDQYSPAVATDGTGNFVVVWTSRGQVGTPSYQIFGQRYGSNGSRLGGEFRVSASTAYQKYPRVAASSTGDFTVVWQTGGYPAAFARRFSSSGAPLDVEHMVNPSGRGTEPVIASDAAGNYVVLWYGFSEIDGQRFSSSGAPIGSTFRVDTGSNSLSQLEVAGDASGDFIAVWADNGPDGYANGVFGRRFGSDGAPRGDEFQVNVYTTGSQYRPSVAIDGSGNFVVIWQDNMQGLLLGRRYSSSGAALTGEFRVDTGTFAGEHEHVASDSSGNFVVTWTALDGGGLGVDARFYASTGGPLGPPFIVNTYTTNSQWFPAIAVVPSGGSFVIAWEGDSEPGGYQRDIYAKRYSTAIACSSGDVNWDGHVDVADVFYLINTLFAGGPAPLCPADVNASGTVDIGDIFYLINYLFAGGPSPVP